MGEYQQRTIIQLRKDFKKSETEVERLKAANKVRDELAAQCAGERDYWEQCVKDAAARAGVDVAGTLGNASLHLIVEEVERLKTELDRAWREVLGWKEGAQLT